MQEDLTKCRWTICVGLASQPLGKSILLVAPCHRSCDRLLQMCMSFFYIYFAFSHLAQWQTHTRGGTQDLLGFEGACYTCKSQLVVLEETLTERTEWLQRIGC